jgi:hypothetical protein
MENVRFVNGKKFMWNGHPYESPDAAAAAKLACEADGFETHIEEDAGKFLLYTRRVAQQTDS